MKPIVRDEILSLGDYEHIRGRFRLRILELKRARRISIHQDLSLVFENRDTVLWQIQEMLRTERITHESAIAHEIETYNELIPGPNELSATLFIEIPEVARREEMLTRLCAIEEHVSLEINEQLFRATFEEGRRDRGRAAAVQYLKFPLSTTAITNLGQASSTFVVCDHPHAQDRVLMNKQTSISLAADFIF